MRRTLVAAAVALIAAVLPTIAPAYADVTVVATLAPDTSAFWDDQSPRSTIPGQGVCHPCHDYAVDITGTGARLRLAIDSPAFATMHLLRSDGSFVAEAQGAMSAELYLTAPAPGRWFVRAYNTPHYRLRARLESVVREPRDTGALLPDLRLTPPYQFTMTGGCNTYEQIEYGAKQCLRFSLGPENIGPGPFLLRIPTTEGLVTPGPIYQRIRHGDGSITERQAGTGLFHKTHRHYHHNGFGTLEILRVTDQRHGTMVLAGNGPKQGFCMVDFRIANWRSFDNVPTGDVNQSCGLPLSTNVHMGLTAGWGDIYVWTLDGNYVEMTGNGDGYYVVRSMADAENVVLETDETNNSGYAYVHIVGDSVTVLERGFGTSPWDPHRRRAADILPPNV